MARISKNDMLAAIRGKAVEDRTAEDYTYIIKHSVDGFAEYVTMCPSADASVDAKEAYKVALINALDPKTNTMAGMQKIINNFNNALNNSGFESKAIAELTDGLYNVMGQFPEIFEEGSDLTVKMTSLLEAATAAGKIIVGRDAVKLKETVAELKEAKETIKRLTEKQNDPNASELTAEEAKRLASLESFTRRFTAVAYQSVYGEAPAPDAVIDDEVLDATIEHYTQVAEAAGIYAGLQEQFPGVNMESALLAYTNLAQVEAQNGEVAADQIPADQMSMIHRVFGTDATIESVIDGYNNYKAQVNAFSAAFGGQTVDSVANQYDMMVRKYNEFNELLATSTVDEVLAAVESYDQIVAAKDDAEAKLVRSERDRKIWKGVAVGAGAAFVATALALAIAAAAGAFNKTVVIDNTTVPVVEPSKLVRVYDDLKIDIGSLAPVAVTDASGKVVGHKVGWTGNYDIRLSDTGVEKYEASQKAKSSTSVEYTDFANEDSASDFIVAYSSEYKPADVMLTANQISPELLQNEGGVVTWTTSDIQLSVSGMQKYNNYIELIATSGEVTTDQAIASIGAVEVSDFTLATDAITFASVEYYAYKNAVVEDLKSQIKDLENKDVSDAIIDTLFTKLKATYDSLDAKVDEDGNTVVDFVTTDENGDEKVVTITLSDAGAAKIEEASKDYIKTSAFQSKEDAIKAATYIAERGDNVKDIADSNSNVSSGDFSNSSTAQDVATGENANKNPSPRPGFKGDDKEPYRE